MQFMIDYQGGAQTYSGLVTFCDEDNVSHFTSMRNVGGSSSLEGANITHYLVECCTSGVLPSSLKGLPSSRWAI